MNRLAKELSSYLRSAAHQPVDWHPWGEEAFETARKEGKPILLDIGAVWCHWCHVMDHESYEDPELAKLLNERFVAVKVDRDERPDVDTRYQKHIQAMTGQGGWPLTAFLLPDGRCFYGGTYFPPRDAHGRPSFRRVLESVAEAFESRRGEIEQSAEHLAEHLARARTATPAPEDGWAALLAQAVVEMRGQFDLEHGGFGRAPKFPHASAVDFLLSTKDPVARDMAKETLVAMRNGGIYDQLVGGFHRYSVDAEWVVPHFEKMLYDNAALLRNYVRAARAFPDAGFERTADEIAAFLRDVLGQPEDGGFGGSQDADVGMEDDGDFFTWTLDELHAAVPDAELAKLLAMHYAIREKGDMHHDPARCVLRIAADADVLSAALGRDIRPDLARGKGRMQEARAKRTAPFVDPILYTSWNAMAIQALLEKGDEDALALKALERFLADAYDPKRGFARGVALSTFGLLDDNAQMLDALLEAHLATGEPRYLATARAVADLVLEHFAHPEGGFADRSSALAPSALALASASPLAKPERPVQDAPTASANGVAIRALLRLAEATGEPRYHDAAMGALRAVAGDAARLNLFGGALLLAMDAALRPPPRIVLAAGTEPAAGYRRVARSVPGATFASAADPGVPEEARAFAGPGAIVCVGQRCLAPARAPEELAERLASLG